MALQRSCRGEQLELFSGSLLGSRLETASPNLHPNKMQPGKSCDSHHWLEEKWIKRGDKHHGPYLYIRWRDGGKLRSKYLGKSVAKLKPSPDPPRPAKQNIGSHSSPLLPSSASSGPLFPELADLLAIS